MASIFDPEFHYPEAQKMKYTPLGKTDMKVSKIGLGGASFGNVYDNMNQEVVNEITEKAVKSGINFIDTAPWYGQGLSEKRLGIALKNIPREKYFIATKVGRYEWDPLSKMFDFSVAKTQASFHESLKNLQLPSVDLIQIHDVDLAQSLDQIVYKTLPALQEFKKAGLARYIGITGYCKDVLKKIVRLSPPGSIDTVLSYGRCNLINQDLLDDLDFYKERNIGVINASPLVMGLLNNAATWPDWHMAPKMVKDACKKSAQICKDNGTDLSMLGMQYAFMQNDYISTHLSSMVNEEQFTANLKTLHSDPDLEMIQKLKKVFDNVPQTQWENIELEWYWKEMTKNGWSQPLDAIDE